MNAARTATLAAIPPAGGAGDGGRGRPPPQRPPIPRDRTRRPEPQQPAPHRPQRRCDQGGVGGEADQALLGGDGDGLGVGDRDGDVLLGAVVTVGDLEGARPVSLDRPFAEEFGATGDQIRTTAGVGVEADLARAPCQQNHQDRTHCSHGHRRQRPLPAPPDRGEDGETGQQRCKARLREGRHQTDPKDRDQCGQQRAAAPFPRPEQSGHRDHDRQRQITAVDVRVPEDGVDPKVGVEFIRPDHLVVPEQAAAEVLDRPDRDECHGLQRDDPQHQREQPSIPPDIPQQRIHQRKRHKEEAHVLQALGEIG